MKYTPKKVFILANGEYKEITYEELCRLTENNNFYADKLFLPLHGMLMEVSKDEYADFYRTKNRQKYLMKQSASNGDISYDMLTTDEFNGEDILIDDSEDIAVQVEKKMLLDKLCSLFPLLSEDEQRLLNALYFKEMSERDWSKIAGIPQKTINDRKHRILAKLKKLLES